MGIPARRRELQTQAGRIPAKKTGGGCPPVRGSWGSLSARRIDRVGVGIRRDQVALAIVEGERARARGVAHGGAPVVVDGDLLQVVIPDVVAGDKDLARAARFKA